MANPSQRPEWVRDLGLFMIIVTEVMAATGIGLGAGYYLWKKSGFPSWTAALCSLLGLALAMFRVYRFTQRKP